MAMTDAVRLDAAAVPASERARLRGGQWWITETGLAALAAAGPLCERLPWPQRPCRWDAGHRGPCTPLT